LDWSNGAAWAHAAALPRLNADIIEVRELSMSRRYILTAYVHEALAQAVYDKLEDQTFAGSIPGCPGVVAFAPTLHGCERELRSTLEDWILLGLKLAHPLPVIGDIDLNEEPTREPVDAL
jgi:predicted RNase H-like HicB family nuclease